MVSASSCLSSQLRDQVKIPCAFVMVRVAAPSSSFAKVKQDPFRAQDSPRFGDRSFASTTLHHRMALEVIIDLCRLVPSSA